MEQLVVMPPQMVEVVGPAKRAETWRMPTGVVTRWVR